MILVIDENLPRSWVTFLQSAGFRAKHWLDIGAVGAPDEVIFAYTAHQAAVILTQDLDFTRMLATRTAALPSVVQLRVDCPVPEVIGSMLILALSTHVLPLEKGCLISIDHSKHRLRLLPIRS